MAAKNQNQNQNPTSGETTSSQTKAIYRSKRLRSRQRTIEGTDSTKDGDSLTIRHRRRHGGFRARREEQRSREGPFMRRFLRRRGVLRRRGFLGFKIDSEVGLLNLRRCKRVQSQTRSDNGHNNPNFKDKLR